MLGASAYGVIGGFYAAGAKNVHEIKWVNSTNCASDASYPLCNNDAAYYDYGFYYSTNNEWTDLAKAKFYQDEIWSDCGVYPAPENPTVASLLSCIGRGSRWSVIWLLNTIVLISLAAF